MNFKNWLKNKIKRARINFYIWEKGLKIFKQPIERTGDEFITMSICRHLIKSSDSNFSIAPLSEKRYIINKKRDIFITIYGNKIEITHGTSPHITSLSDREIDKIKKQFDNKVEFIRIQYEEEIKAKVINNVKNILEKIKNECKN